MISPHWDQWKFLNFNGLYLQLILATIKKLTIFLNDVRSAYIKTVGKGSFKAEWTAKIPEDGEYEVLIWCPRIPFMKTQSYVIGGEGQEEQKIDILLREGEWNSLGVFDFKRGESYVILSDQITQEEKEEQSNSQVGGRVIGKPRIVADAVKWVPLK